MAKRTLFRLLLALLLAGLFSSAAVQAAPRDPVERLSHECGSACRRVAPPDPLELQAAAMLPQFSNDPALEPWDRYQLTVTLEPDRQRISGALRIVHTNRSTSSYDTVWLHAYPNHPDVGGTLSLTAVFVDGVPVERIVRDNGVLIGVPLPAALAPSATVTIDLGFITITPLDASRTAFGAFNLEAGVWALGTFYPILARTDAAGAWDTRPVNSLGDYAVSTTALYDVTINAPAGWQIAATGAPVSDAQAHGQQQLQRFVSGPQREFFIAALQGLEELSSEVDGTLVRSFVRPGRPDAARRSLETAAAALRIFNQRFGPYPFRQLIVVEAALTNFYGMEYPGVVLIDSGLYARNDQRFETTVAHEVAHQWWFGLVGNDAQSDAWLDEGWASYSEVIYYRETGRPEQAAAQLAEFRRSWTALRDSGRDTPLNTPLSELSGRYVAVVYSKAALFLAELERELGSETFQRLLLEYVAAARYRDVDSVFLLDRAADVCRCDLQPLTDTWLFGVNPPLP